MPTGHGFAVSTKHILCTNLLRVQRVTTNMLADVLLRAEFVAIAIQLARATRKTLPLSVDLSSK
jgi:hypothetical protein